MNRKRKQELISAAIGIVLGLLVVALTLTMGGCSTVHITRNADGEVDAKYSAFMMRMNAPAVMVERKAEDEYKASFNAESVGSDLEAMRDIIQMVKGGDE